MDLLHEPAKRGLAELLQAALSDMGLQESLESIYGAFSATPNTEMGHLAFPCFTYSKALRLAPPKIAEAIAERLPASDWIAEARPTGPYLNFFFNLGRLGQVTAAAVLDGSYFQRPLTQDAPRTMIEYSQPNTHKELHVGHMRNMALGDALIRLHRYAGYDIVSTTFPGDVGTHVAKCLWYMRHINTEPVPVAHKGAWLGKMYTAASVLLADLAAKGEDGVAKAAITEILKELEAQHGPYFELWKETRLWSIALMEEVYAWADIHFDVWYWESDVDATSVAYAKELFAQGKLVESKGAIGLDLSEDGLGFALLVKSDGTGLYATKDVELARRKFEDFQIAKSVYIVDNRQSHHFKQVFKVLEKLGFEAAKDCYHLAYEHVEGPTGPFSSRLGNAPAVVLLIDAMKAAIVQNYLASQLDKGELTQDEAAEIADTVAKGAIKYGMLRIDPEKKIVFVLEEWISLDGDSGPYLQYTYARINSLCRKQGFDPGMAADWALLSDPREGELLTRIAAFNDVVLRAVAQYRPNMICAHLYGLAQLYNNVNNAIILRDIEDPVLKNTRLALHAAVAKVIQEGLALLGIPVPARM
jgi:arginyl-tRNA synthetase